MKGTTDSEQPPVGQVQRFLQFAYRVLRNFMRNHGILLAGGVGYNVLLSAVPMLAVLAVLLTRVVNEEQLLEVMAVQAQHFAPSHASLLLDAVRAFMESRDIIGIVGLPVMLFFSSFAFRMLEDSIAIIFHRPDNPHRNFWVSAVLPYAFILILGAGLLALTLVFSLVNALYESPGLILYLISFVGVFILFSAIYKVLPIVRISPRTEAGSKCSEITSQHHRTRKCDPPGKKGKKPIFRNHRKAESHQGQAGNTGTERHKLSCRHNHSNDHTRQCHQIKPKPLDQQG